MSSKYRIRGARGGGTKRLDGTNELEVPAESVGTSYIQERKSCEGKEFQILGDAVAVLGLSVFFLGGGQCGAMVFGLGGIQSEQLQVSYYETMQVFGSDA